MSDVSAGFLPSAQITGGGRGKPWDWQGHARGAGAFLRARLWAPGGGPRNLAALGAAVAMLFGAQDIYRFLSTIKPDTFRRWKLLVDREAERSVAGKVSEPTVIYDVRGRVVATLSAEQPVPLAEVSDPVWQAIVASEDHRFFDHNGVDAKGLSRAVLTLGRRGGGSTITQQLVKNLLLSQERTITRKAVEIVAAFFLENRLSKPELLEEYINNVYWGHGVYGITPAAAAYFRKKPSELNVGEAALLSAMLPGPERLSPFRNPTGAARARKLVLQRMLETGYIDEAAYAREAGRNLPPALVHTVPDRSARGSLKVTQTGVPYRAPYFVSEVLYQLRDLYGGENILERGGLQIHTTLDLALQERAESILKEDGATMRLGEDKGEASLVACEPTSGAVRVLVGGRNYAKSSYNRAVVAARSPGSAFKPFVYLAALATNVVTPSTEVEDEEVIFKREGAGWRAESKSMKEQQRRELEEEVGARRKVIQEMLEESRGEHEALVARREKLKAQKFKELAHLRASLQKALPREGSEGRGGGTEPNRAKIEATLKKIYGVEDELGELEVTPAFEPDPQLVEEDALLRDTRYSDDEEEEKDEEDYQPFNYSKKYRGTVTLKESLCDSLNIPTVKLANLIGIDKVVDMAHKLGVRSELPQTLSLALGACEVTPLEMACAYNTIAAGGVYSRPHLITKVKAKSGEVIYRHKTTRKPVVNARSVADLHRMLRAAVTKGTGRRAAQGWPSAAIAGKTGTSDDYRDAWFAGYTSSMTCVVWVGRDDNSSLPGTGGTLAAPVWARFMRAAHGAGIPAEKGSNKRRVAKWRVQQG